MLLAKSLSVKTSAGCLLLSAGVGVINPSAVGSSPVAVLIAQFSTISNRYSASVLPCRLI